MAAGAEWQRLKQAMRDRRIKDLGWQHREPFLEYKGVGKSQRRLMAALENAERDNYDEDTLTLAEGIYEWASGSIADILAGKEPTPIEDELGIKVARRRPQPKPEPRASKRAREEIHQLVDKLPAAALLGVRNDLRKMVPKQD